jgi:hypothetical protein
MTDWGKGIINNIGWGQSATNNIGYGSIYSESNAGQTLLVLQTLFDEFVGGAFGSSLRLLKGDYAGGLVRTRAWNGAADQGQADVMPYQIGSESWVDMNSLLTNLDATAISRGLTTSSTLANLVDAGGANYDGFVPTIYEQLNGNHFNQPTALRQGSLVTAGVLNTLGGKPVINRSLDDNGSYLSTFAPNGTGKSLYYVGDNNSKTSMIFGSQNGNSDFGYTCQNNSNSTNITNNPVVSNQKINGESAIYSTRGDLFILTDKQFLLSTDINFNFDNNVLALGYRFDNPSLFGMYSFQEHVIFDNQLDRVAKETNINNAFKIYNNFLLEDGGFLLQENGSKIKL